MIDTSRTTRPVPGIDRERAIESFIPLAHHLVKAYAHWSIDRADLIQIALLGIIVAIDSYDPESGFTLGQYVGQQTKWALGDALKTARRQCRHSHELPGDVADDSPAEDDRGLEAEELWDAVEELPKKDRSILIRFYGLDGRPPCSRDQLSKRHRRSVTTISKSTTRSLGTLRQALSA